MEGFWAGVIAAAIGAVFITPPSMAPGEWEWAAAACEANGGVQVVRPAGRVIHPTKVRCKNGAIFVRTTPTEAADSEQ